MNKAKWLGLSAVSALVLANACAQGQDETQIIYLGPDGSTAGTGGVAGSAGTGGKGGTGGTAATGGTGGTAATGGTGGTAATGGTAGSAGADAGSDSSTGGAGGATDAGSDAPDYDASGPCTPNTIQEKPCGACGTSARLCDTTGTWLEWSACSGETGECTPGTQTTEACGKCGTITYFCSASCVYLPGPCENEGICSPGELNVSNASCPTGQVRTSACTNTCTAGNWTPCSTSYTWQKMADSPLTERRESSSFWNGSMWIVAGGYGSPSPYYKSDAAMFDPANNTWTALPAWPSSFDGRERPALGGNATKTVIWGGYASGAAGDGIVFDVTTQTWSTMSTTSSPGPRYDMAYAWDGTAQKLIVFGGRSSSTSYQNNLHSYDPATDTWVELPQSPLTGRVQTQFAWDKDRRWLYIWGGYSGSYLNDGAIYDADANKWRALPPVPSTFDARREGGAAVASDKFVVFGGYGSSPTNKGDGIMFDPVTNQWTMLPTPPLDERYEVVAASDGQRVAFWGGEQGSVEKGDGAIFDPANMKWQGMSEGTLVQSPEPRYYAMGDWTPQGIIVWGGYGTTYLGDGKIYKP